MVLSYKSTTLFAVISICIIQMCDPKPGMFLQHPLHVFLFDALTPLMNWCRALGDAGEAARVCHNIITSLEKVVSGYSLELANFYFCPGELYMDRADESSTSPAIAKRYRKQGQDAFQKVRLARKICLELDTSTPNFVGNYCNDKHC